MKIAIIASMSHGGLQQFIFRDIKAFKEKGHDVSIFTLRYLKGLYDPLPNWTVISASWRRLIFGQLWFLIRHPGVYVRLFIEALRTGSLIDLAIAVSFVDRMRDMDVIYAYFGDHKLFTGYYCKRIANIPLIASIRAYELYYNPNPRMFPQALAYCDRIVTICEYNKDVLVKRWGVPPSEIDVVRQIVDLEIWQSKPKIKILIVGFFAKKKGHDVLFKALKQLNRDDVELWVVGDATPAPGMVDCRGLAKELGVESRVAFFGKQRDNALRAVYRECDIFCLPSRTDHRGIKEGFPNVIAEAMAFSKPVVATRHAGIAEVVNAVLVDENSVEQLAEALNEMCNSAELRRQLGDRNRTVVERLFSSSNNDRLEEILLRYSKSHSPTGQSEAELAKVLAHW